MSPHQIFLTVNGERRSLEWLINNAPEATDVRVGNCAGLDALPALPKATVVWVENCAGLKALLIEAGNDSRGYNFIGILLYDQWFVSAGCHFLSIADARRHWGKGGVSDRPDCLALVEKIAAQAAKRA